MTKCSEAEGDSTPRDRIDLQLKYIKEESNAGSEVRAALLISRSQEDLGMDLHSQSDAESGSDHSIAEAESALCTAASALPHEIESTAERASVAHSDDAEKAGQTESDIHRSEPTSNSGARPAPLGHVPLMRDGSSNSSVAKWDKLPLANTPRDEQSAMPPTFTGTGVALAKMHSNSPLVVTSVLPEAGPGLPVQLVSLSQSKLSHPL